MARRCSPPGWMAGSPGLLTLVWYDVTFGPEGHGFEDVVVDAAAGGCGAVRRW